MSQKKFLDTGSYNHPPISLMPHQAKRKHQPESEYCIWCDY